MSIDWRVNKENVILLHDGVILACQKTASCNLQTNGWNQIKSILMEVWQTGKDMVYILLYVNNSHYINDSQTTAHRLKEVRYREWD